MSPEAQRIAIAEACGWRVQLMSSVSGACQVVCPDGCVQTTFWVPNREPVTIAPSLAERIYDLPDYLSDLNAMHEAERVLSKDQRRQWEFCIADMFSASAGQSWFDVCHMTAAQRAEAFLRTLNLWDDSK